MSPLKSTGRNRAGGPFAIANAVKPSKAPITLAVDNSRAQDEDSPTFRQMPRTYAQELVQLQDEITRRGERLAEMERRLGQAIQARQQADARYAAYLASKS